MSEFGSIIKEQFFARGVIIVDDIYGNDLTGVKYDLSKPFKTIQKAIDIYVDNDEIQVNSGIYNLSNPLLLQTTVSNKIIFDFKDGSRVLSTSITGIFRSTNSNQEIHIKGNGYFSNTGAGLGANVFSMAVKVYGADVIHSTNATPFSMHWMLIENVNHIYSENRYGIEIVNQDNKDGFSTGTVRNVKKIGGESSQISLRIDSQISTIHVVFENCNFVSTNFCLNGLSINNNAIFTNCTFRTLDLNKRCAFTGGKLRFYSCYFENNGTLETFSVKNDGIEFTDCKFKNISGGKAIETQNSIQWNGTNYVDGILSSITDSNQYINGVVISSFLPVTFGLQYFSMVLSEVVPTVGGTYTITTPDTSFINYIVLPGDSRDEILNSLLASWILKANELNNDFANFSPFINTGLAVWNIEGTVIDESNSLSQSNGFVLSVDNADSITNSGGLAYGFTTVGGNLKIDSNLSL